MLRYESSATSLSWIPSEAVEGMTKLPFEMGIAHYDPPPPDVLEDLDALRRADAFRFANELRAWIEVEGGRVVRHGQSGGGRIGSTTVRIGPRAVNFAAVAFPDLRPPPEVTPTSVRFVQTAGGRTGAPAPRHVRHKPFVQVAAPVAWSTLSLTLRADGSTDFDLVGASPFPRHWVYGHDGKLALKTGMIDFDAWYRNASGAHTPWGDEESPAFVTVAETAVERELSRTIMGAGRKPRIRRIAAGDILVRQGEVGRSCSCCWTACSSSTSPVRRWPRSARAPSSVSGRCSRGQAHVHPAGGDAVQGGGGRRRRPRPRRAGRGRGRAPPGGRALVTAAA